MTSRPRLLSILFALHLLGAASTAMGAPSLQDAENDEEGPSMKLRGIDLQNMERVLRGREREFLHPTVPLELVGIEEGDNEFRSASPLLEGADDSDRLVDVDEHYRRRIAMYESGPTYGKAHPSSALSRGGRGNSDTDHATGIPAESADSIEESGWRFSIIFWLALGVLAATLGWKRRYYLIP